MALEIVESPPALQDFTLLSEHEEQTPNSFFPAKPVLHLHSPGANVKIPLEDVESQPALAGLRDEDVAGDEGQVVIEGVDIWVSSRYLTIYSSTKAAGVQISFPSIAVHAQEGNAVLLGLNLSDSNTADEDLVFIQLRIIPTEIADHTESQSEQNQQPNGDATHSKNPSQALFTAISNCQELNPDPPEAGDEEPDETAPGATGWITSENMHDFVDETGELRIPQGTSVVGGEEEGVEGDVLGGGAGRTRTAAEADAGDGAEDETKWQKTG